MKQKSASIRVVPISYNSLMLNLKALLLALKFIWSEGRLCISWLSAAFGSTLVDESYITMCTWSRPKTALNQPGQRANKFKSPSFAKVIKNFIYLAQARWEPKHMGKCLAHLTLIAKQLNCGVWGNSLSEILAGLVLSAIICNELRSHKISPRRPALPDKHMCQPARPRVPAVDRNFRKIR